MFAALAMAAAEWWIGKSAHEVAFCQLTTEELCMPFGDLHRAVEDATGRPVFTHEFAHPELLIAEIVSGKAPTMGDILGPFGAKPLFLIKATGGKE